MDGATGVYLVIDRAQDMFFVLMENNPSDRVRIQVRLRKIIYDAFSKPIASDRMTGPRGTD